MRCRALPRFGLGGLRVCVVCRELSAAGRSRQPPGFPDPCIRRCGRGRGRRAVSRRRPISVGVEHQGGALLGAQPQALSRLLKCAPAVGWGGRDPHAGGGRMLGRLRSHCWPARHSGPAAIPAGSQCQLQPQGPHRSGGGVCRVPASSAQRKGPAGHPVLPSQSVHTLSVCVCVCVQRHGQQRSGSACACVRVLQVLQGHQGTEGLVYRIRFRLDI